jgi:predicted Fe-Mo cluster-binding NifX family protein
MSEKMIVALPTSAPGGLGAELSGHFGHCDVFTLVTLDAGQIENVAVQQNVPHEQGGCMAPVMLLAECGAKALVAGGMGMRPLMGFNSVGIEVFFNNGLTTVEDAVAAFSRGQLPRFTQDYTCGGGGQDHSHGGGCGGH